MYLRTPEDGTCASEGVVAGMAPPCAPWRLQAHRVGVAGGALTDGHPDGRHESSVEHESTRLP